MTDKQLISKTYKQFIQLNISLGTQLLLDSHLKYEPALPKRSLMKFGGVRTRMNSSSAGNLKENIRKSLF